MTETGRDNGGRWKKGTSGNPNGRPPKEREAQYREILFSVVTPDQFRVLCEVLLASGKARDIQAARLLIEQIIGKAVERHEFSGPNGNALTINLSWGDYATDDGASPETA